MAEQATLLNRDELIRTAIRAAWPRRHESWFARKTIRALLADRRRVGRG